MAISSFSQATRETTNSGYNAVYLEERTQYFSWFLKTEEYPDQTYTVTLDGVDYDIRLRWNTRDESWQMSIGLSGDPATVTFKVTNGLDLLQPYRHLEAIPDGRLYMVDTVKINGRPGYSDTGIDKRFTLVYIDSLPSQA